MRFLIGLILVLGNLTSFAWGSNPNNEKMYPAQELQMDIEQVRIYVKPSEIFFTEKAIYILQEGNYIQVNSVAADSYGLYVLGARKDHTWTCPKCGYFNKRGTEICASCGWPVYDD